MRAGLLAFVLLLAAGVGVALSAGPNPPPRPSASGPPAQAAPGRSPGQPPPGQHAPARPHAAAGSGPQALIDGDTVVPGPRGPSIEEEQALADGFGVTVVTGAQWDAMSAAQFAAYQVLIVGDPSCNYLAASATSNAATWAPVVMGTAGGNTLPGNRVLIGTDPVFHYEEGFSGALKLIKDGIAFAGALSGRTGLYFDVSCDAGSNPALFSALDGLSIGTGTWTEDTNPPCGGSVSLIASNASFSDLTSADLQGWNCSVHETFPSFKSDWAALAVATDTTTAPTCGTDPGTGQTACGEAYILLAGQGVSTKAPDISVAPQTQQLAAGGDATVTATVTSGPSQTPVPGQLVTFTVTGQNNGATGTCSPSNCQTNSNGQVSFTYHDGNGAGDDTVVASFTSGGTTEQSTASVTWLAGAPTISISTVTDPVDLATVTAAQASGTTSDPVATVQVTVSDSAAHTVGPFDAIVDSLGNWSVSGMDLSSLVDGTITYTATATNASGSNSATKTATKDTTPPAVPTPTAPPDGSTVSTSSPTLQWSESDETAATFDVQWGPQGNCTATTDSVASTSDPLEGLADGTYCWHVRALDSLGNASAYSQTFTFTVQTVPVVTIVSTSPTTIGKGGTSTVTWHANQDGTYAVRVGGSCSGGTLVANGPYLVAPANATTDVPASALSAGTNTIVVCVSSVSGTGSDTTAVTLDATSPKFTDVPAPIVVQAAGPDGAVVTYTPPKVFDPDDQAGPVSCSPPSGSVFPVGTTTVTCTATDTNGNKGTAKFDVTVQDTTSPDLTVPADFSVQATGPDGAVVTYTVSATDAVDPNPSVTCSPASGSTFPVGTTTVTCTATDASGNSTTKTFNVTVTPAVAPPPPPGQVGAQTPPGKTEAKVKLPGTNVFVPLGQLQNLPPGTEIDVSGQAAIGLTDPAGNVMYFFGVPGNVPSTFVFQGIVNGVVQLVLSDAVGVRHFSAYTTPKPKPKAKVKPKPKEKPVARLWGSGKGRFTTKGKYASATVRGTIWVVADYKDFTRVTVKRGLVAVQNLVTKKTVQLAAGHSIIVRKATKPKTPKKKSTPKKP